MHRSVRDQNEPMVFLLKFYLSDYKEGKDLRSLDYNISGDCCALFGYQGD